MYCHVKSCVLEAFDTAKHHKKLKPKQHKTPTKHIVVVVVVVIWPGFLIPQVTCPVVRIPTYVGACLNPVTVGVNDLFILYEGIPMKSMNLQVEKSTVAVFRQYPTHMDLTISIPKISHG